MSNNSIWPSSILILMTGRYLLFQRRETNIWGSHSFKVRTHWDLSRSSSWCFIASNDH